MSLSSVIKQLAGGAVESEMPTRFMFGSVASLSPLTIRVENRFEISEEQIVIPKELTAGTYATHRHSTAPHTHQLSGQETSQASPETTQEVRLGLSVGDGVVVLRNWGGQQYLVLGRV